MSIKHVKDLEVKCPNGHVIPVPRDVWEYDVVEVEDKSERGMGLETHHRFSVKGGRCSICGAEFDASVDVWEYPEGTIETTDKAENVVSDVGDAFVAALD